MKIIFFGSGSYTIPIVKKLINHGLEFVITTEKDGELVKFCKAKKIDLLSTNLLSSDLVKRVKKLNPTVGILASFGGLIPDDVINSFKYGIINIHPSRLPKYKGPSPIQYTLLNGDTQTGVTLIRLDNKIDHGPILSQRTYKLKGNETTEGLLDILFAIGANMTAELLSKLEKGETLVETPQNHRKESWTYKITKEDGYININNPEANSFQLSAMISAYHPWPGVWFTWRMDKGKRKIVKLLPNDNIQVEGKKPMSYKDFVNGYGNEAYDILCTLNLN